MKKKILLFLTVVVTTATLIASCNNDDNNGGTSGPDVAIGTWKLIEAYQGTQSLSLTSCQLLETYIIGQDGQFSHELFGSASGRPASSHTTAKNGGTNVMNGDDDGDDDGDDEHGGDDGDDDGGATGGGTGGGTGTTCVSNRLDIGYWAHHNSNAYVFTVNNVPTTRNITFIENNTKFTYEITTVVGSVSSTIKYVFQRQ